MSNAPSPQQAVRDSYRRWALAQLTSREPATQALLKQNFNQDLDQWKGHEDFSELRLQEVCAEEKRRAQELHYICTEIESRLKNELEALYALGAGRSQIKIDELSGKLDSVLPALATRDQQKDALATLTESLNTRLEEVLDRLVSAESFEGRLMSSTNMLYEAQSKAISEAVASIRSCVEKRLAETTAPINQRLSSLLTVSDWERLERQTDQKVAAAVAEALQEGLNPLRTELAEIRQTVEALHAQQDAIREIPHQVAESMRQTKDQIAQMLSEALWQIQQKA